MSGRDEALLARDREARRLAQTDFERPIALEAGAGTGKTAALVCRAVAWCLGPGWARAERALQSTSRGGDAEPAPDEIAARALSRMVAITFTEAAAAEMASRLDAALGEIDAGKNPTGLCADTLPADREVCRTRARALRGQLDRLVVRTIHAYCRRLLASNSVDAGLHPSFEVDARGARQAELIREVVERAMRDAFSEPGDPEFVALAVAGVGPVELEEALDQLLSKGVRPEALDADPFAPERVEQHRAALSDALHHFLENGGEKLSAVPSNARSTHATLDAIRATRALADARELSSPETLDTFAVELRATWSDGSPEKLRKWAREDLLVSERKLLGAAVESFAQAAAEFAACLGCSLAQRPHFLETARRVLRPLLAAARSRLRARGIESFSDLLVDARDLLAEHPDVLARERARIDQLLVDEFQDTDALQCDLLRLLALEGPREQRPGLFLVGDPKQSIYGWRNADLAAYEAFVARAVEAGGLRLSLFQNFRSAPPILSEVERVCAPVMTYRTGLQPSFEPLVACAAQRDRGGFEHGEHAPVEHWLSCAFDENGEPQKTTAADAVEIEARALARDLRALRDTHDVPWQRVGVLFRSTGDLERYLAALRDADIPYAVEHDRSYYQRREIIEATALIRCILDPNDHLALVTWLRSASVGVPDAALIPLWTRRFPALVTELESPSDGRLVALCDAVEEAARATPQNVPGIERVAGWEQALIAALEALAALRESFETQPADVFLERVRRLSLLEATEAARTLGAYRTANLQRLFRELLEDLEEGRGPQALLRRLRRAVGQATEAKEGRPLDSVEDAVQIMTIHGAKGLGFQHVYLMQLHKTAPASSGGAAARAGWLDGCLEYELFGAPTLGFDALLARRREVEDAERVRTLYVAMTRARERLVLAGIPPELARAGPSHAQLLAARRERPELAELAKQFTESGASARSDVSNARWVAPARRGDPTPAPRDEPDADGIFDPRDVDSAARSLLACREAAAARQQRPFRGTASEEDKEAREDLARVRHGDAPSASDTRAPEPSARPRDPDLARHVGTALHLVLERFDLRADPAAELRRQRDALPGALLPRVGPEALPRARRDAEALLDRLARGSLLERLRALEPHIVARELPVLLPPRDENGPVGFVGGAIDLLYRDPESGGFVVADYKTDAVETDAEIAERAAHYAAQGRSYARAVREALALSADPRVELWFLRADRVERIA